MIPKILHIIWIGDDTRRPDQLIDSWRAHHPGWELRVWGNEALVSTPWRSRHRLYGLGERDCAAVADAMRWEILYAHGGVCVAADSVCLRPLDDALLDLDSFTCWENELVAPGQLCAAYVGCHPGNALVGAMVEAIANDTELAAKSLSDAVGSGRFTELHQALGYEALTVLPSACFVPRHPKAACGPLTVAPYACELWASTLGILPELAGLNAKLVASTLDRSQHRAVNGSINLVVNVARLNGPAREVVEACAELSRAYPGVRLSLHHAALPEADTVWLSNLTRSRGADLHAVAQDAAGHSLALAVDDAFAWTMMIDAADPFTVNHLRACADLSAQVGPEVAAIGPAFYLGLFGDSQVCRAAQALTQPDAASRLRGMYGQDLAQGMLSFGLIRTPVVRQWLNYTASRGLTPSYSDHLLSSLMAVSGQVLPVPEPSVLVRDQSAWATPALCVASDARCYPQAARVLFHELFWVADLVRLLAPSAEIEALLAVLQPKALALLTKQFKTLDLRLKQVARPADVPVEPLQMKALALTSALEKAQSDEARCDALTGLCALADEVEALFGRLPVAQSTHATANAPELAVTA